MEELGILLEALPYVALIVAFTVGGWVFTTWLRIKNGYPLETSWGTPLHPASDRESVERIRLLTSENAQLRAEIGSIKDRLETSSGSSPTSPTASPARSMRLAIDKGGNA